MFGILLRNALRLLLATVALAAAVSAAAAEDYFEPVAGLGSTAHRYESPRWDAHSWGLSPAQQVALVAGEADSALLAVASNFNATELAPPHYVRAMALFLARQLEPEAKSIRLADYQLKYRRQPPPVPDWEDRDALTDKLWELAWQVQELSPANPEAGLLLLDLAAAFGPSELESMQRYRELSQGQMELRWSAVLRLAEGIDAPDMVDEALAPAPPEADVEELPALATASPPAAGPFEFNNPISSLLVPAAEGSARRFVRLEARVRDISPQRRREIQRQANRLSRAAGTAPNAAGANKSMKLPVEFTALPSNASQLPLISESLQRARVEFLRGRDISKIPASLGVEFRIAEGGQAAAPERLAAAGALLLQSMADGLPLAPDAALAGGLGFGGTLRAEGALAIDLLQAGRGLDAPDHGLRPVLAVPIHAEASVADLAALGELRTLVEVQIIGCRRLPDAVQAISIDPPENLARAMALFADLARAAEHTSPEALLANPAVRQRLAEVVGLCPEHLSAAQLLRYSSGRDSLASLESSFQRLRMIETEVRSWVAGQLDEELPASDSDNDAIDARCASTLGELRRLRPRMDTRARPYSDSLAGLVEDLRASLRSRGHGPISTARSEELLRSLDSLDLQIAGLGLAEPE